MELFKGYVETRGKKCIEKFKNRTDFKGYDQVKNLPEFAGILADNVVLIDIDDYDQSEILMKMVEDLQLACRVYETTRGKHFLFKNTTVTTCKTHTKLACGLTADIKLGTRNSYSVLKYDNVERKIIYDIFEDEEYQSLPMWLLPIKSNIDFLTMKAGDGRNQSLFNYILTLQSNDFSVDEARQTIKLINKYVLPDKLSDSEINTILRDEAFEKPVFYDGKTFLHDKFGNYLINTHHILRIDNQLHLYRDGIYIDGYENIEAEMIKHISNLNKSKRSEVMSYIDLKIRNNTNVSSANHIAFKNGIYDIDTGEFEQFDPSIVITNKINYVYDPNAYSEIADKTLNKLSCNDPQIRALLEEVVGYTFYRRNELRKSFILIGDKANGKSTYLDMIKTLLGDENTCSLDLNEIGDRFKTAELFGKLANIGDDIGDGFIPNPAIFKKVVSGEAITVERKGQDPFKFNPYSKLLFSANNIPRIKDKSGAVVDRLVIIPFDASFSPDDPDFDPYIKYKLRQNEPMQYLIKIGIEGLKRVLDHRRFTICDKVQRELVEYEENNNPILMFFKEVGVNDIENNPTREVYRKYQEWCITNSFQPMSNIEFSKQVKKHFDFKIIDKTIQGKKYRIFVRKEST